MGYFISKIALVTGGEAGIGLSIALTLAQGGANIVIITVRSELNLTRLY